MSHRVAEVPSRQSRTGRSTDRGRAAARPARRVGGGRSRRQQGHGARAARHRWRPAGRRAGARLPARAVRRPLSWGGSRLCRGAARAADGGWRPCGLDRAQDRAVRAGSGRARPGSRAPDRGPGAYPRGASLGARGSLAQSRTGRRARRDRAADPHPEPATAARRRDQGRDRFAAAAVWRRRPAERGHDPLAGHGGAERAGGPAAAVIWPAALADRADALPRRPHRQLADRLARGWLA